MRTILFLSFFFLIVACKVEVPAPPVVEEVCQSLSQWDCAWELAIKSKLPADLIEVPQARMGAYCPRWDKLSNDQKKSFWALLWYAVAKYESERNPKTMYWEKTQGIDEVTKQIAISEGLLQLSYQDDPWLHCGFDYAKDKDAHLVDVSNKPKNKQSWVSSFSKTINDPVLNLVCGGKIASHHLARFKGTLQEVLGKYWSTIRDRTPEILAILKLEISECYTPTEIVAPRASGVAFARHVFSLLDLQPSRETPVLPHTNIGASYSKTAR